MASRGRRGVPAHEGEQRRDEPRREDQGEQHAPAPQGPVLPPPPPVDYGVFMQGLVQAMQTQAHTQAALQAQLEAQAQAPVPQAQDHGGPSIMERFMRMSPPSFKGESDPLLAESWMWEIEKIFRAIRCTEDDKVTLATYMLQERADVWWSSLLRTRFEDGSVEVGAQRSVSTGGRDGAVPGGEEGFSKEADSSISEAREKEGDFLATAASRGIGKQSCTFSTFPCCFKFCANDLLASIWVDVHGESAATSMDANSTLAASDVDVKVALQMQLQAQVLAPAQQDRGVGGVSVMERFKRMAPPSFKGESQPLVAESWLRDIQKIFRAIRQESEMDLYQEEKKAQMKRLAEPQEVDGNNVAAKFLGRRQSILPLTLPDGKNLAVKFMWFF
ncbi:hypothetical protein Taro_045353 [Colocasia esculenta]|uniref:Uncharacterized protein n=1 Tax=Colocasia esculenta TaxID=4460 RepID=A0A843X4N6_COLES|nr:hypothetical protein [Colocasia esculenta]